MENQKWNLLVTLLSVHQVVSVCLSADERDLAPSHKFYSSLPDDDVEKDDEVGPCSCAMEFSCVRLPSGKR